MNYINNIYKRIFINMSNISNKDNVETIVYKGHGFISIIKYNKYGDLLFIGDKDSKKIILYDVINKNIIGEYTGHNGVVWGIEITDDSKYMFSCSGDLSVIMWNVYDGSIINKLELKGIPKNINKQINANNYYCFITIEGNYTK